MPLLFLLVLAWLRLPGAPAPSPADAIVGRWRTADQSGIIQLASLADGSYAGTVVGPVTPVRLDAHNPDVALRRRPLLGVRILQGFHYDDGAWTGGTIYDPGNGKTYSCTLRLRAATALEVRGYLGVSLFGRTEVWQRLP